MTQYFSDRSLIFPHRQPKAIEKQTKSTKERCKNVLYWEFLDSSLPRGRRLPFFEKECSGRHKNAFWLFQWCTVRGWPALLVQLSRFLLSCKVFNRISCPVQVHRRQWCADKIHRTTFSLGTCFAQGLNRGSEWAAAFAGSAEQLSLV